MPATGSSSANVLSTWILLDDQETASQFPQAGRSSSSDGNVHLTYWRCVAVFFAVARRTAGPEYKLRLYTGSDRNVPSAPPFVAALLRELKVEIHVVPLTHLPPVGYYGRFRNQFYIFDILKAIAGDAADDNHVILDSDCLCLRSLDDMFRLVEEKDALTFSMSYPPEYNINGLTRLQMREIFEEMSGMPVPQVPVYYGGEFYASTATFIRKLVPLAAVAWEQSLERFHGGKPKLNEEAHLLTYLYTRLAVEEGTGNRFIERLWTGIHFRNGVAEDARLPIVHLPSEKRFGFVTLYRLIQDKSSWFYREPIDERWVLRVQKIVSVPRPSPVKLFRELAAYATARLIGKSR